MLHKSDKFGELTRMHKELVIFTGLLKANSLQSCMMVEWVIRCLTRVQIRWTWSLPFFFPEQLTLKQQLQFSGARSCTSRQRIILPPIPTKTINEVQAKDESESMPATYRAFHTEHLPNRQGLVEVPYLEKISVQQGREKQKFQLPRLQLSGVQQQRESLNLGTISSSRYKPPSIRSFKMMNIVDTSHSASICCCLTTSSLN